MNSLLFMIPISLLVVVGGAAAFFWAVNHDQFDDLDAGADLPIDYDPVSDSDAGPVGKGPARPDSGPSHPPR